MSFGASDRNEIFRSFVLLGIFALFVGLNLRPPLSTTTATAHQSCTAKDYGVDRARHHIYADNILVTEPNPLASFVTILLTSRRQARTAYFGNKHQAHSSALIVSLSLQVSAEAACSADLFASYKAASRPRSDSLSLVVRCRFAVCVLLRKALGCFNTSVLFLVPRLRLDSELRMMERGELSGSLWQNVYVSVIGTEGRECAPLGASP